MWVKIFRNGKYYLVKTNNSQLRAARTVLPTQTAVATATVDLTSFPTGPVATIDLNSFPTPTADQGSLDLGNLTRSPDHIISITVICIVITILVISIACFFWGFCQIRRKQLASVAPKPNVDVPRNVVSPTAEAQIAQSENSIPLAHDSVSVALTNDDSDSIQNTLIGVAQDSLDAILNVYEPCPKSNRWSGIARKLARRSTESIATEDMFPILS